MELSVRDGTESVEIAPLEIYDSCGGDSASLPNGSISGSSSGGQRRRSSGLPPSIGLYSFSESLLSLNAASRVNLWA